MKRILEFGCFVLVGLAATGCQKKPAAAAGAGMHAMPVQTATVTLASVPLSSEYVSTIESRRSATLQPQVSGTITQILVHSGQMVKAGQPLIELDPRQQMAVVAAQRATERQKKALYDYNEVEVERQKKLFDAGVTSRDAYDQERQAYENAKADYHSAAALRKSDQAQLAYYTIRAPYDGMVGDIPVHVGDYATTSTMLTTVDEGKDLEVYIYVPTDHAGQVRKGLAVELLDNAGNVLEKTAIDFVSAQVDGTLQGILVKAPVHSTAAVALRNAQMVQARIIWSTSPMAVVPVLAVVRESGQPFVFVLAGEGGHFMARQVGVALGDTVGNDYAVTSGLKAGDKVIVSSTQFLVNGMPVMPLG